MWRRTRANPGGVDLMRNAPLDAPKSTLPDRRPPLRSRAALVSRSRRQPDGIAETAALCRWWKELLSHGFSIAIDCHSGFGVHDRIWFPYAHTARPIPHLAEMHALMEILDQTHSHHRYVFEPQSRQYLAHGDLWDYLYLRSLEQAGRVFLPLTLEMGSWLWVKKNPRQLLSRHGIFNPLIEHRRQRVLRRHLAWLDFMTRAASGHALWQPAGERANYTWRAPCSAGTEERQHDAVDTAARPDPGDRVTGELSRSAWANRSALQVICLDLPGNGRLNHMQSPLSVEAMADYCHAELACRGIARPAGCWRCRSAQWSQWPGRSATVTIFQRRC
jgi:hypothetical protein